MLVCCKNILTLSYLNTLISKIKYTAFFVVKQSLAINKHYLFHNRMSYNIIQLHDDIKHVWNISRDFMTQEGGAPRCQKVMRYLPYILKIEHCTFEQYKIRLVIPFADNWSQKSARNVIPFSSIQGI